MNVNFIEEYIELSEIREGQSAVSKDRESFFVCGYRYDSSRRARVKTILDLNNLLSAEDINMNQQVRILKAGDQFSAIQ